LTIQITNKLCIDDDEIQLNFIRSAGPGGQNVNKVCTAVQLRFNVSRSAALSDDMRRRLIELAGNKVAEDGTLIIKARRFRSQDKNRKDAIERLADLIRRAAVRPKARRKTKPSRAARERRLTLKKRHAEIKSRRRRIQLPQES
jgi:ribosome-associated protein